MDMGIKRTYFQYSIAHADCLSTIRLMSKEVADFNWRHMYQQDFHRLRMFVGRVGPLT